MGPDLIVCAFRIAYETIKAYNDGLSKAEAKEKVLKKVTISGDCLPALLVGLGEEIPGLGEGIAIVSIIGAIYDMCG